MFISVIETVLIFENIFVKCSKIAPPLDKDDELIYCVYLMWETDDENGQSYHYSSTVSDKIEARKWYGLAAFPSIRSVNHVIRSKHFALLFSESYRGHFSCFMVPDPIYSSFERRRAQNKQLFNINVFSHDTKI